MANEVVVRSGKTLKIGDVDWIIVDAGVAPVVPSLVVENRVVNGSIIYLSLAETVIDAANPPEARVCARLRFDLVSAQIVRNLLSQSIENAQKPVEKDKAN